MIKTLPALALITFVFAIATPASATHVGNVCLGLARVPYCGSSSVAACISRKPCTFPSGRTIKVCTRWLCIPRRLL